MNVFYENKASDQLIIELDGDQYPTDKSLEQIKNYKGDFVYLLASIAPLFEDYGRCVVIGKHWKIATGGWSGCEDTIEALRDNQLFWLTCWYMSKRGGYYEFKVE